MSHDSGHEPVLRTEVTGGKGLDRLFRARLLTGLRSLEIRTRGSEVIGMHGHKYHRPGFCQPAEPCGLLAGQCIAESRESGEKKEEKNRIGTRGVQ